VGDGDPAGVAIVHAMTSGIGGMRTAGDLVARMQMTRRMKNADAKKYVADKLGIALSDLTDAAVMGELRADLKLGTVYSSMGSFKGIEAKRNVAELLGIEINCLKRFRQRWAQ
jgi:dimethylamine--corrinoid protein Co-methyltransferase